jgi:CIC family chloride channel protein
VLHPPVGFLLTVLLLKITASVISLSFGFRGGLFFASLFLGSLIGQIFAGLINMSPLGLTLDPNDAALIGMAALSVAVVGGPMTLSILMLEITHDFALMGVVITATLIASAFTRETFGYSFSTWRLHVRGSNIRSPRDIGWMLTLTASSIMRKDWVEIPDYITVKVFRERIPLGSTSKIVLADAKGHYRGIVTPAFVYRPDLDETGSVAMLAVQQEMTLSLKSGIHDMLRLFDKASADELVVVDEQGQVLGIVTEKHARRRYFDAVETSQRDIFGES